MGFLSRLLGGGRPDRQTDGIAAKARTRSDTLFDRALGKDPAHSSRAARRKAAFELVLADETGKAREAWLAIGRDFPADLPGALEQVGVCYHLERDYRCALDHYEAAIRLGVDAGQLAEPMAEARKGLAALG